MKKILYILLTISLFSCIEDYDFKIKEYSSDYTIDAVISNSDEFNYVRISKVQKGVNLKSALIFDEDFIEKSMAVENAIVSISDNDGNTYYFTQLKERTIEDIQRNGYGYYPAPKGFYAEVGKTYTLNVKIDDNLYTSTQTVTKAPIIDKLEIKKTQLEIQKDESYVPYISYTDVNPNKIDYFITILQEAKYLTENEFYFKNKSSSRSWAYSIFNDEFLGTEIRNFKIDFGTSSDHSAWYPQSEEKQRVVLLSVNKQTYDFFKVIISQIKNEGGLYSQSPGSPRSNIKGGALGYFIAANISMKTSK